MNLTFSEIIQKRARYPEPWFILNEKLIVKDYIKSLNIDDLNVAKVLQICENPEEVIFQKGTVVKLNALSRCNLILYPDEPLPKKELILKTISEWLKIPTFKTKEYKNIFPKVFIEEFLPGTEINWKFFCMKGEVLCCLVKIGDYCRKIIKTDYTDSNIEIILKNKGILPPKPKNWEKMIKIAGKLSEPFDFVRVDLYNVKNKIYFGELTFTPCSIHFQILDPQIDKLWLEKFEKIFKK